MLKQGPQSWFYWSQCNQIWYIISCFSDWNGGGKKDWSITCNLEPFSKLQRTHALVPLMPKTCKVTHTYRYNILSKHWQYPAYYITIHRIHILYMQISIDLNYFRIFPVYYWFYSFWLKLIIVHFIILYLLYCVNVCLHFFSLILRTGVLENRTTTTTKSTVQKVALIMDASGTMWTVNPLKTGFARYQ